MNSFTTVDYGMTTVNQLVKFCNLGSELEQGARASKGDPDLGGTLLTTVLTTVCYGILRYTTANHNNHNSFIILFNDTIT